jgi:serine phosphatase RsbU (regulator of sigma subunit)
MSTDNASRFTLEGAADRHATPQEWGRLGRTNDGLDSAAATLLLVEDDSGDALIVEDQLSDSMPLSRLIHARTLAEALAAMTPEIDCVLLDLRLPDAGGLEAVEAVRGKSRSIPLIVLTGLDDEAAGVAALGAGAQDYLVKGRVDSNGLARAIRYAIERRHADEVERALMLAQAEAREAARLERGLAPQLLVGGHLTWVASCYRAGRRRALLGGDFYDVVETADGGLRALVGDVCGHGPDEAALGVCLRSAWRALTLSEEQPADVMAILQRVFEHERHLAALFATVCTLQVWPEERRATVIQAGHPLPLLISGAGVVPLTTEEGGPAIGIGATRWEQSEIEGLPEDWALLLYTDGIVEGYVGEGATRLGEAGLRRMVAREIERQPGWREDPHALLDALLAKSEQLNEGPLVDDVAMLLIGPRQAPSVPS